MATISDTWQSVLPAVVWNQKTRVDVAFVERLRGMAPLFDSSYKIQLLEKKHNFHLRWHWVWQHSNTKLPFICLYIINRFENILPAVIFDMCLRYRSVISSGRSVFVCLPEMKAIHLLLEMEMIILPALCSWPCSWPLVSKERVALATIRVQYHSAGVSLELRTEEASRMSGETTSSCLRMKTHAPIFCIFVFCEILCPLYLYFLFNSVSPVKINSSSCLSSSQFIEYPISKYQIDPLIKCLLTKKKKKIPGNTTCMHMSRKLHSVTSSSLWCNDTWRRWRVADWTWVYCCPILCI